MDEKLATLISHHKHSFLSLQWSDVFKHRIFEAVALVWESSSDPLGRTQVEPRNRSISVHLPGFADLPADLTTCNNLPWHHSDNFSTSQHSHPLLSASSLSLHMVSLSKSHNFYHKQHSRIPRKNYPDIGTPLRGAGTSIQFYWWNQVRSDNRKLSSICSPSNSSFHRNPCGASLST